MAIAEPLAGMLCTISTLGIGSIAPVRSSLFPAWLRLPIQILVGTATVCVSAILTLVCGGGVMALRALSGLLLAAGIYRLATHVRFRDLLAWAAGLSRHRLLSAMVIAGVLLSLLPAIAPSSKADEIRYHMLIPKRIVSDNGLRPYREPWEAAIYPQTGYEMGQSILSAWGLQDAPNMWSWGMVVALVTVLVGAVAELTKDDRIGLLAGAMTALCLHLPVNMVTAGSHAPGDLAMVVAVILTLLPDELAPGAGATEQLLILSIATSMAAMAKISMMPVCVALTALGTIRCAGLVNPLKAVAIPLAVWIVGYAPLVVWSELRTGSPFGVASASLFHSGFYSSSTLERFAST